MDVYVTRMAVFPLQWEIKLHIRVKHQVKA